MIYTLEKMYLVGLKFAEQFKFKFPTNYCDVKPNKQQKI